MNMQTHSPRSRALGMHLVLMLVTGLLASQLLVASQPLSTPTPARPITFNSSARSISSFVSFVAERMTIAS